MANVASKVKMLIKSS